MKYVPYILIVVLAITLLFSRREVEVDEIHVTDTITLYKTDTLFVDRPVEVWHRIVDTFYVEVEGNSIPLPKEQKLYSKDKSYDIWVSGYNPSLDSCKIYNHTEYRTITNDIIRYIPQKKWNIYGECGFSSICGNISPKLGVSIVSPKRIKLGANMGLYNRKISYGLSVGIKLNK